VNPDVADKHGLITRHLSQWRGVSRKGKLVLPGDRVPLVVEPVTTPNPDAAKPDDQNDHREGLRPLAFGSVAA
jgi:hypothetical protein